MYHLYAFFLGGRAKGCNTELHDVVFAVGETLEETFPLLVNKWFGQDKYLHIDAYVKLTQVNGYDVVVNRDLPPSSEMSLYFVNLGAYKRGFFGELHECGFYVAASRPEALAKAKKELCLSWIAVHCDDNRLVENLVGDYSAKVDDVLTLKTVDQYSIQLTPATTIIPLEFKTHYQKLDLPEIVEKAKVLIG